MYQLDHDHESAHPQRIAELEARVDWLETAIAQILGEPPGRRPKVNLGATPKPLPTAEDPPVVFDLWMLRTHGMPPLAPSAPESTGETKAEPQRKEPQRNDPRLGNTRALSTLTNLGLPPRVQPQRPAAQHMPHHAPRHENARPTDLDPGMASALAAIGLMPAEAPVEERFLAKTQPLTPSVAPTDFLGITAAFATLDAQLSAASQAEAALHAPRKDPLPWMNLEPGLIDAACARTKKAEIEVRSAIEEQYPSILQKITAIWHSPEIHDYLKKLVVDDRGTRNGFDPAVMSELIMLYSLLERPAPATGWGTNEPFI